MTESIEIEVVAAVITRGSRVLLARRPEGGHLAGFDEFPGGKVREGEDGRDALERELDEEVGVLPLGARRMHREVFEYPERRVRIDFFRVERFEGEPRGLEGQALEWVEIDALRERRLPPANAAVVAMLEAELRRGEGVA